MVSGERYRIWPGARFQVKPTRRFAKEEKKLCKVENAD